MKKIDRLIKSAKESAEFRGHFLSGFLSIDGVHAGAVCRNCKRSVDINTKPLPNEIDIQGEAVAVNCERRI